MTQQQSYNNQTLATYLASAPTTASTSMAVGLLTPAFNINQSRAFAMQFVYTGTPTGTLKVMGSFDGVNFNVSLATSALAGSAGTYTYDMAATAGLETSLGWVRGEYAATSGTGVLSAVRVCTKYPAKI